VRLQDEFTAHVERLKAFRGHEMERIGEMTAAISESLQWFPGECSQYHPAELTRCMLPCTVSA
jgi:hypothetical protein